MTGTKAGPYHARMTGFGAPRHPEAVRERRSRVLERLAEEDACLVAYGGRTANRSLTSEYRFRPDSNFHYLTELEEPGGVLVLNPKKTGEEFTLFVRPRDERAEIWNGRRVGPEGAKARFGASAAHPLSDLAEKLPDLLDGARHVYVPTNEHAVVLKKVFAACELLHRKNRDGKQPPQGFMDIRALMAPLRLQKDSQGLESQRRAVALSAEAHRHAMGIVRPGMREFEVEAEIAQAFRQAGSSGPGYASIVASGANATILHYVENEATMVAGQLLLIDAGAEWDYHTGDITRTFPVSGTFSPAQRDLYELVLRANLAGIECVRPGSNIAEVHRTCVRVLAEGMRGLGLLKQSVDEIIDEKLYEQFYMHRTSHWLGLDVHDVGAYCVDGRPNEFASNMVLTVEPGIYIGADDETVPAELRGTGIRVEDDVLVTETGHEVLSADAPKTIADIETWMAASRC